MAGSVRWDWYGYKARILQSAVRMWKNVRRIEGPAKFGRLGVTGTFAVVALLLILVAGWLVDRRVANASDRKLAALARESKEDPAELIARASRANRIVFLADIHNSAATKELAARAVQKIASLGGLDAVIVEVGADQQPYIDQYLDRPAEDASVLLSHPRSLGDPGAATRAMLDLYHTIWKLNEKLGADQRIRIIAADLPGWPSERTPSPSETAHLMSKRDEQMHNVIDSDILAKMPEARVLIFMTGFHGLKTGTVLLQTGGAAPVTITPLAERLAQTTDEVYTILVDAPSNGVATREIAPYLGTRIAPILSNAGVNKSFATSLTADFDYLRQPLVERKTPGLDFGVNPRDYKLRDVADAYINVK